MSGVKRVFVEKKKPFAVNAKSYTMKSQVISVLRQLQM